MPYSKKSYNRVFSKMRMRKKRRYAGKLKRLEKKVSKISRSIEKKYYDNSFDYVLDWDGDIHNCNGPASGLGDDERVGDKIFVTSLSFTFTLRRNNAGDIPTIRVIGIWDKLNTISSVSQLFIASSGNSFTYLSEYVVDDRAAFSVLFDKLYQLDSAGPNNITRRIKKTINKTTQFEASTTTITKGLLRLIFIASTDSAQATKPLIQGYTRVRYTDI